MKIETKFEVGDCVLILVGAKLEARVVSRIVIEAESNGDVIVRNWFKVGDETIWKYETASDEMTFATKEEFLNQLETGNK